jgi:hypothetical protein
MVFQKVRICLTPRLPSRLARGPFPTALRIFRDTFEPGVRLNDDVRIDVSGFGSESRRGDESGNSPKSPGMLASREWTGSGINAHPITFTHNGQQYITVLSGIGGVYWHMAREMLKNGPQGGSVWTFALIQ